MRNKLFELSKINYFKEMLRGSAQPWSMAVNKLGILRNARALYNCLLKSGQYEECLVKTMQFKHQAFCKMITSYSGNFRTARESLRALSILPGY